MYMNILPHHLYAQEKEMTSTHIKPKRLTEFPSADDPASSAQKRNSAIKTTEETTEMYEKLHSLRWPGRIRKLTKREQKLLRTQEQEERPDFRRAINNLQ
jgi:hypothetical protein